MLDEPTSVLTPGEAQEVLGLVRAMTKAGDLTVLMISHKFHEVTAFADDVSVLRKGRLTGTGRVTDLDHRQMAAMMIGDQPIAALDSRAEPKPDAEIVLKVKALKAPDRTGLKSIRVEDLGVRSGEIVGIAGIPATAKRNSSKCWPGSARAMPAKSWCAAPPMRQRAPRRARSMSASSLRNR
ncbi:hypothetical protein AJ88_12590 [Mesorhizobium amorphae CCBAU 01583]|nr:hypothetical protein AJ88_12590 [Mesorhizobium amorphae CCBAU 01583]